LKSNELVEMNFFHFHFSGHEDRVLSRGGRTPSVHGSVSSIRSTDRYASPDQERVLVQVIRNPVLFKPRSAEAENINIIIKNT
jgi:hypothetical protein